MANSFNISVKPEIAALEAKVDIIDAEVDTIRSTDIPGVDTKLTTVDAVVDNIRNIDVPNIQTNIDANETKIDTIDDIVDAVKLKTDLTPQLVRGTFNGTQFDTTSGTFVTVLTITGSGKLCSLGIKVTNAADTIELRVTIDSFVFQTLSFTGSTDDQLVVIDQRDLAVVNYNLSNFARPPVAQSLFDIEFSTSLLIEIRRSAGTGAKVVCRAFYSLDTF